MQRIYRWFLIAVLLFYITDILWGVLEALSMTEVLYVDTELYFIAMALSIFLWTRYVIAYLENRNAFQTFLFYAGTVFFAGMVAVSVVNLFTPVLFRFDENGGYHEGIARNISLLVQIFILLLTSVYALRIAARTDGAGRNRHYTIGLFGLVMLVLITIQIFHPYLPLYAIGYMLGCSLLRTFVIENEKEEYRRDLESALAREKKNLREFHNARKLAYTDPLTGVKSRLAFGEKEEQMDKEIYDGDTKAFSIVVFDLNGLKQVNDSAGHEAGDRYIVSACRLICGIFRHSPVYRVGGDEFVAILEGADYENRGQLMEEFARQMEENRRKSEVIIAAGAADYDPTLDSNVRRVFERADDQMYERKKALKQRASPCGTR